MHAIALISVVIIAILLLNYCRNRCKLFQVSRNMWDAHVALTREWMIDTVRLSPVSASTTLLMQNQEDIGNFFASYYGESTGKAVTALLKEHIALASTVFHDLQTDIGLESDVKKWQGNAIEIGTALDSILGIEEKRMQTMMLEHLALTTVEAKQIASNQDSSKAYNIVHAEAMGMADMIAKAIASQNTWTLATSMTLPCCS